MAFTVSAADLYAYGAPESYFSGVPTATVTAQGAASLGECSRRLSPRAGGPASGWTFTDTAGEAECRRDIAIVWAGELALTQGLTLPGEGADPLYAARMQAIRERWSRMGAPGDRDSSKSEPLYAGLVDATPAVSEGHARGYSGAAAAAEVEL
jgi:hypothetical protein